MNKVLKAYLVGGAVRDELLGIQSSDRDWVVVGATPEQMIELGYQQVGSTFPCFLHPITKEEHALARTEKKSGSGYTGFICDFNPDVTLEEDLSRRDLTINAIAKDKSGQLIDPYGGINDLEHKTLRHVTQAFVEDPLRVLRVARFAARFHHLGFKVAEETYSLMTNIVQSGELSTLTPERVWQELSRALAEETPSQFFWVLRACGALKAILPELDALFGVPQPIEHHPEVDSGLHTMMSIDIAQRRFKDLAVTWSVLMHDLGKGITPKEALPRHIGHESKGVPLVKAVCTRLKVPKSYQALSLVVTKNHLKCHQLLSLKPTTVLRLLESIDAFRRPERVLQFVQACEADANGRTGRENEPYPQAQHLIQCHEAALAVTTEPLIAAGYQGRALGEQLRIARIAQIKCYLRDVKNTG